MKRNLLSIFSFFLMQYTIAQSDVLWEKTIGGKQAEFLYNAVPTPDYGFIVIGSSESDLSGDIEKLNQGGLDYFIWKMDENGQQEWQKSFGGDGDDLLKAITITKDGGFLLVGSSNSSNSGDKNEPAIGSMDLWIIKLDPVGNIQWQKTIGGAGNEEAVTVIRTKDEGYIIGANSDSPQSETKKEASFGSNDYWIIKLDEDGSIKWEKTFGGEQEEALRTIVETKNGYLIGGISNSQKNNLKSQNSHYLNSVWLIEINKEGDLIQEKTFENTQHSTLLSLINKDNKLVLATTYPENNELKIIELDDHLSFSNEKSKEFKSFVQINSVLPLEQDYLITANTINYKHTSSTNQNELESKYLTYYFDNRLEEKWKKDIGKSKSFSYLEKVIPLRDGSFLLLGNSNNSTEAKGQDDFYIVKLGNKSTSEQRDYIEVYPNPTNNFTNILINKAFDKASIEIYNLTGQHLQSIQVKYRSTAISLGNYPSGIYILKINYDNQTESIKIIKK